MGVGASLPSHDRHIRHSAAPPRTQCLATSKAIACGYPSAEINWFKPTLAGARRADH